MPPICLGQSFISLKAFKVALREWAIENRFDIAILDSDSRRVRAGCRSSPLCPFKIRCNWSDKWNAAIVSTIHEFHTCKDTTPNASAESPRVVSRAETSKLKFLLEAVPKLITVHLDTSTKEIIDAVKAKYGQEIALRQAQKVKASLCPKPPGSTPQASNSPRHQDIQSSNEASQPDQALPPTSYTQAADEDSHMQLDTEEPSRPDLEHAHHDSPQQNVVDYAPRTPYTSEPLTPLPCQTPHSDRIPSALQPAPPPNEGTEATYRQDELPSYSSVRNEPTPQEVRAEAAALFQRASEKFQEATLIHAEATRLFASVANA